MSNLLATINNGILINIIVVIIITHDNVYSSCAASNID